MLESGTGGLQEGETRRDPTMRAARDLTDPNRLDADRDGVVCERNAAPYELVRLPR